VNSEQCEQALAREQNICVYKALLYLFESFCFFSSASVALFCSVLFLPGCLQHASQRRGRGRALVPAMAEHLLEKLPAPRHRQRKVARLPGTVIQASKNHESSTKAQSTGEGMVNQEYDQSIVRTEKNS